MKVKDVIKQLKKLNKDADIIFVYGSDVALRYNENCTFEYNQTLEDNKITVNDSLVLANLA